jgi:NAD(P)-dependent dehydrogenase (short-subunit alcohol dehydrogenase family)
MKIAGKVVVVTGGANGIGRALATRFVEEGARHVAIADLDEAASQRVANEIDGARCAGFGIDVTLEADVRRLVAATEAVGPIDLFCSNAGILATDGDARSATSAPNETWERAWAVNVMAHVYAARAALPAMIARKSGYFLHTVSAAGLLSQIAAAPYSTTKHAAIGFAESLAITHKDDGIKVSVLCPQAVDTAMIHGQGSMFGADVDGVVTPAHVAEAVVEALERETFLVLPHPKVAEYMTRKIENYDRWLGGMAKMRRAIFAGRS